MYIYYDCQLTQRTIKHENILITTVYILRFQGQVSY